MFRDSRETKLTDSRGTALAQSKSLRQFFFLARVSVTSLLEDAIKQIVG